MLQGVKPSIDLKLAGVTKVYPGVVALQDVDLAIASGEVVGLIGENGAGKSTLMKVLGGTIAPNAGAIVIDGTPHAALTPAEATAHGIAFVHQELNPFTNLDVAANVLLGREIHRGPFRFVDRAAMARRVEPILKLIGARFGPNDPVSRLALADVQLLEIARALSMDARLVILDEPTSGVDPIVRREFPALGQGLLISAVTKNQFVASQIALLTAFLPSMTLSGFIFEIPSMPAPIQAISYLVPAGYLVPSLQTVFVVGDLWPMFTRAIGALLLFGLVFVVLAIRVTRRRIA